MKNIVLITLAFFMSLGLAFSQIPTTATNSNVDGLSATYTLKVVPSGFIGSGSTFTGDLSLPSNQIASSYPSFSLSNIQLGDIVFDASGKIYEVVVINGAPTAATVNVEVKQLNDVLGFGIMSPPTSAAAALMRPTAPCGLLPPPTEGPSDISASLLSMIHNYNENRTDDCIGNGSGSSLDSITQQSYYEYHYYADGTIDTSYQSSYYEVCYDDPFLANSLNNTFVLGMPVVPVDVSPSGVHQVASNDSYERLAEYFLLDRIDGTDCFIAADCGSVVPLDITLFWAAGTTYYRDGAVFSATANTEGIVAPVFQVLEPSVLRLYCEGYENEVVFQDTNTQFVSVCVARNNFVKKVGTDSIFTSDGETFYGLIADFSVYSEGPCDYRCPVSPCEEVDLASFLMTYTDTEVTAQYWIDTYLRLNPNCGLGTEFFVSDGTNERRWVIGANCAAINITPVTESCPDNDCGNINLSIVGADYSMDDTTLVSRISLYLENNPQCGSGTEFYVRDLLNPTCDYSISFAYPSPVDSIITIQINSIVTVANIAYSEYEIANFLASQGINLLNVSIDALGNLAVLGVEPSIMLEDLVVKFEDGAGLTSSLVRTCQFPEKRWTIGQGCAAYSNTNNTSITINASSTCYGLDVLACVAANYSCDTLQNGQLIVVGGTLSDPDWAFQVVSDGVTCEIVNIESPSYTLYPICCNDNLQANNPEIVAKADAWVKGFSSMHYQDVAQTIDAAAMNDPVAATSNTVGGIFTAPTGQEPYLELNSQNGLPSIVFEAANNDKLESAIHPPSYPAGTPFEVTYLFSITAGATYASILSAGSGSITGAFTNEKGRIQISNQAGNFSWRVEENGVSPAESTTIVPFADIADGLPHLLTMTYDALGQVNIWLDGIHRIVNKTHPVPLYHNFVRLGRNAADVATPDMKLYEFLLTEELDPNEIVVADNGISCTWDVPYQIESPTTELSCGNFNGKTAYYQRLSLNADGSENISYVNTADGSVSVALPYEGLGICVGCSGDTASGGGSSTASYDADGNLIVTNADGTQFTQKDEQLSAWRLDTGQGAASITDARTDDPQDPAVRSEIHSTTNNSTNVIHQYTDPNIITKPVEYLFGKATGVTTMQIEDGSDNILINPNFVSTTVGIQNISFGSSTLANANVRNRNNTIGSSTFSNADLTDFNNGFGYLAGSGMLGVTGNNAIGAYTLLNSDISSWNNALGARAGQLSDLGSYNNLIGYFSGASMIARNWNNVFSGGKDSEMIDNNVILGTQGLENGNAGSRNTFIASNVAQYSTLRNENYIAGRSSFWNSEIRDGNTSLGFLAGHVNEVVDFNTLLGAYTSFEKTPSTTQVANFDFNNVNTADNTITIGAAELAILFPTAVNGDKIIVTVTVGAGCGLAVSGGSSVWWQFTVTDAAAGILTSNLSITNAGSCSYTIAVIDNRNTVSNSTALGYHADIEHPDQVVIGNQGLDGGTLTEEIQLNGFVKLPLAFPISGAGVDNGSFFKGTDGALYWKNDAGVVTQIAP